MPAWPPRAAGRQRPSVDLVSLTLTNSTAEQPARAVEARTQQKCLHTQRKLCSARLTPKIGAWAEWLSFFW
jgi:hypothetical protein